MLERFYAGCIGGSASCFLHQVLYCCIVLAIQHVCMPHSGNDLVFNRAMFLQVQFYGCNRSYRRDAGVTAYEVGHRNRPCTNAAVEVISKLLGPLDHMQWVCDIGDIRLIILFLVLECFPLYLKILHGLIPCHVQKRDEAIDCVVVSSHFDGCCYTRVRPGAEHGQRSWNRRVYIVRVVRVLYTTYGLKRFTASCLMMVLSKSEMSSTIMMPSCCRWIIVG